MCVAPNERASSSFSGLRSTATIGAAPASRAPAITWRPTPPHPITHTDSPRATRPALRTAPIPVTTPHPRSAACQSGSLAGIFTAPAAATTVCSAKHAVISACWSVVPFECNRLVPSMSVPAKPFFPAGSQRFGRPDRQARHERQAGTKESATWSPGAT